MAQALSPPHIYVILIIKCVESTQMYDREEFGTPIKCPGHEISTQCKNLLRLS